jgi:hypothetical protein
MDHPRHKKLDLGGKVDTATQFDSILLQKAVVDYESRLMTIPDSELARRS